MNDCKYSHSGINTYEMYIPYTTTKIIRRNNQDPSENSSLVITSYLSDNSTNFKIKLSKVIKPDTIATVSVNSLGATKKNTTKVMILATQVITFIVLLLMLMLSILLVG